MNAQFLDLLVHPLSREPLIYQEAGTSLVSGGDIFPCLAGVPVLLPPKSAMETAGVFNYQEHYEQDAKAFDYFEEWQSVHREENRRLHEQILSRIPADARTILDVGCGGAWLAKALIPEGRSVISMDISTTNPLRAMEVVPSERHFGLIADVFHLPLREAAVDCIVASEIIEHVQDPELFIARLFRALKPGGCLIITTPFNEVIPKSLCIHCNQLTPHNAHIHSFTKEKLKAMAPGQATSVKTATFNSKVLINLHIHVLLRFLPFRLWLLFDKTANTLFGSKAMRLMLVVKK
jgi:2-polyprenyl-3-methyl-5-hydroxy-6-metoxy-1,4-benzoquinol methylase/uncharacterized protein YbaR (Trm112 family)